MNMYRKIIQVVFALSCWIIFAFMAIFWFYKYKVTDRDIGVVDLVLLEDAKDVEFPIPSLCFIDPFLRNRFDTIQNPVKRTEYLDYLKGNSKVNSVELIDFDDVTMNLNDYYLHATEIWKNDSDTTINSSLIVNHENIFNGFNSNDDFVKCFSLDVDLSNHRYIKTINFHYNTTKFFADWKGLKEMNFGFKIHKKGQFLIGEEPSFKKDYYIDNKGWWSIEFFFLSPSFEFTIYELEFIEGRNSKHKRCGDGKQSYDYEMLKKHISQKGCRTPYLTGYNSFPLCNTSKDISFAKLTYGKTKTMKCDRPCKRIAKLLIDETVDSVMDSVGLEVENIFRIHITFPDEVKTIVQSKEVDIHTLIGNIGGYLGLFMGYAVVQIPTLIFGAYDFLKAKSQSLSRGSKSLA